ncbi:HPr-rel-A system PqqD family peptide chaperone [Sphingomonas sp. CFBP 13728]|uniref:HPr-rel-A system PqqD family peptide chaperone n=1 Tax=Sphingomonas sp. CFBP 13728 TaxID=2775294 RepID=UPI003158FDBD
MIDKAAVQPAIFRAPEEGGLLIAPLDEFTAVYHRASGITHLLTEPAPQILAILGESALSLDTLLSRLGDDYDLEDADRDALAARLDELIEAGLVERL